MRMPVLFLAFSGAILYSIASCTGGSEGLITTHVLTHDTSHFLNKMSVI